jgi:glycine C-acetyltransferase
VTSLQWVKDEIQAMKDAGRFVPIKVLESPQGAWVKIEGNKVLNMCSNNYLGLANHPEVKKAAIEAIEEFGVGAGAVRSIAGTNEIHFKLEEKVAKFKHMEASLVYQGGLLANSGTIPSLVGKEDYVLSEELNHASIIDGVRLSGAQRGVYKHLNMADLDEKLKENVKKYRRSLVISDGVFSMDGDLAPLPEIVELA